MVYLLRCFVVLLIMFDVAVFVVLLMILLLLLSDVFCLYINLYLLWLFVMLVKIRRCK